MKRIFFLLSLACALTIAHSNEKPNIIIILADDLGYGSLGAYGNMQVKTPNIDQLATNGVKLTDFHSNGAMCSPTRAALMTGRYQQRCAWVDDAELSPVFREQRKKNPVQRWAWGISPQEVTLPQILQKASYQTAIIGKWHLGYDEKFHPQNFGFSRFYGFMGGGIDYHLHIATHGARQLDWWNQRALESMKGYATDLLTDQAKKFIIEHQSRPFFLYLSHATPHSPWQVRDPKEKKSAFESYREMITSLDDSVGVISNTLRHYQLEENTLLLFCSDNGPQAPHGFAATGALQGKKGSMLEAGHRVPCIATWRGKIPAGITSNAVAMSMDFFPTCAKLASAIIPSNHIIDGIDLIPLLLHQAPMPDRTLHWKHGDAWTIREGSWKLIGHKADAMKLFNLATDLSEKHNLIVDHPNLVSTLVRKHKDWIVQVGDK